MEDIATKSQLVVKEMSDKIPIDAGTVLFDFLVSLSGEMYSTNLMYFVLDGLRERLIQRGYKPEDADKTVKVIVTVLSSKRSAFNQEFMG